MYRTINLLCGIQRSQREYEIRESLKTWRVAEVLRSKASYKTHLSVSGTVEWLQHHLPHRGYDTSLHCFHHDNDFDSGTCDERSRLSKRNGHACGSMEHLKTRNGTWESWECTCKMILFRILENYSCVYEDERLLERGEHDSDHDVSDPMFLFWSLHKFTDLCKYLESTTKCATGSGRTSASISYHGTMDGSYCGEWRYFWSRRW